mgnify:CR=1 FL=1
MTDIHRDVYMKLEVLFIIDNGMFKQYFTKKAFERALEKGVEFYSNEKTFNSYVDEVKSHHIKFKEFFEKKIQNKEIISQETLQTFFYHTVKLCKDYTMMNIEHTDKAFTLKEQNKTIKKNLDIVSILKDKVRDFMNTVLFEDEGYAHHVFKILSGQFSVDSSILENLTQKELLNLYDGRSPNIEAVQRRQECFISTYNNDLPYEGATAREIAKKFEREEITDPASVKNIEYEKRVKGIKYTGPQSVRTIRGLGAFMRGEVRSDLSIEQMHTLVEDYGEFELVT